MNETPGKSGSERARDTVATLLSEWRQVLSQLVDEAERFTREKPSVGLAAAFLAGTLFGSLFRRR
jgi:ElaB/YqjD/DUF883 family membrane-anchored ribosome-binding protein